MQIAEMRLKTSRYYRYESGRIKEKEKAFAVRIINWWINCLLRGLRLPCQGKLSAAECLWGKLSARLVAPSRGQTLFPRLGTVEEECDERLLDGVIGRVRQIESVVAGCLMREAGEIFGDYRGFNQHRAMQKQSSIRNPHP